jgi:hypothetical protein
MNALSEPLKPEQDAKGRFVSGNIGGGRPKGARNKLGEAFIEALKDDFETHGKQAIVEVRETKPDQYLKVIASLMPKDVNLNINDQTSELTDEQLIERMRELDAAITPFLAGREAGASQAVAGAPGTQLPAGLH